MYNNMWLKSTYLHFSTVLSRSFSKARKAPSSLLLWVVDCFPLLPDILSEMVRGFSALVLDVLKLILIYFNLARFGVW